MKLALLVSMMLGIATASPSSSVGESEAGLETRQNSRTVCSNENRPGSLILRSATSAGFCYNLCRSNSAKLTLGLTIESQQSCLFFRANTGLALAVNVENGNMLLYLSPVLTSSTGFGL
ncbi:hypothetical protein FB567DRAFT_585252 [Paraphoma chrysanthemicola]|uniref:Cyanovirin-N domain-containing protein n=1 Tax=Paraphoma chrysanthemicola TaxID=798071 RepID=A0A8K0QRD5_9PLEO|nr:hypothetical protein FB567DRAFT_585252 [Paraphoma chrysanthemicola]